MTTTLLHRKEICHGTWEFTLAKPKGVSFKAGQHINIKLPELLFEDPKGPRRTFTLASAPHEENWLIATRMTGSGFKKTLLHLPLPVELEFLGPMGTFYRDERWSSLIFLAGGIGITPFRSMIVDLYHNSWPAHVGLFYANRNQASIAYHELFSQLTSVPNFHYVPTLNAEPDQSWSGERRMLGLELLQSLLPDMGQQVFYLCGPPALISDLTAALQSAGITSERILSESFWGYP